MKKYEIIKGKFDGIGVIVKSLCENGLSIPDVIKHLESMPASVQFDLVVKDQDDTLVRVPFSTDLTGVELIGICPFKDSDYYIATQETYQRNDQCDIDRLPKIEFMQRISEVRHDINDALAKLNMSKIEGIYHVHPVEGFAIPMVVEMTKDVAYNARVTANKAPALVRYGGIIKRE